MYKIGLVEEVCDNGLVTVSPVGKRSNTNSWIKNVRLPAGVNAYDVIGHECIYDYVGTDWFIIGAFVDKDSIPGEYIEMFGREDIIWAGDYRAIRTKTDGTIAISKISKKDDQLVISDILVYSPSDERLAIMVDNISVSAIGASVGENFNISKDTLGNVKYTFKGKTNINDKANRFSLTVSNPISPHDGSPAKGLLEFEVDNTPSPLAPSPIIPDLMKIKLRMGSGPDGKDGLIATVNDMIVLSLGRDLADPNHLFRIQNKNLPFPFESSVNMDGTVYFKTNVSELNVSPLGDVKFNNTIGDFSMSKDGDINANNAVGSFAMSKDGDISTNNAVGSQSILKDGTIETKNSVGRAIITKDGGIEASNNAGSMRIYKDGKVRVENSAGTFTISKTGVIKAKGTKIIVEAAQVEIKGGLLAVNGISAPTGGGPFCGIANCLFTGAPHTGNKVTGT